jgi:hypothetical protein
MSRLLYIHFRASYLVFPAVKGEIAMKPSPSNTTSRRIAGTLILATVVAGLMLVAAWLKRSAPVGSTAQDLWEGTILVLAVTSLFIPVLALRTLGGYHAGSNKSR